MLWSVIDANALRLPAIRHENDGLRTMAAELDLPGTSPFIFLCECRDPLCGEYIRLTLDEYDAQRGEHGFVLGAGHKRAWSHAV